ncbi:MAG: ATP-dependent zinc metalloprotease FtsH [Treponema sp.]|nr:ATP-dependent zinc metalloprotease FtsH [Treponema sp.]
MSDEEKKEPDNKNEKDPYNFFKLSTEEPDDSNDNRRPHRFPFWTLMLVVIAVFAFINMFMASKPDDLIDFSVFRQLISDGKIVKVEMGENTFVGYGPEEQVESSGEEQRVLPWMKIPVGMQASRRQYKTTGVLTNSFIEFLDSKNVTYRFVSKQNGYLMQILLNLILPFGIIFLMYFFIFRKMSGGMGGMGSIFGAGSSRAKAIDEGKVKTRFADVAGVDEAKDELIEVVDFLKNPKKYTDIGGKIPKGVLLVGPPGTGKTLLARAVAGEAQVPFFRISGSDFVEMFVGVGASRVRDLFRQAREKAPCIIFIDELDAIGKSRVNNLGGNDEREQTLNQLLVEMDGFDNEKGLIILAATNRADILDPALLRPGRFDRQVPVERPDVKGREAILRIHAKNVKIDGSVDFDSLAHGTTGFAGADLANVVNEAALLAVRNGRTKVSMSDFNDAIDKVSIGLKKKTRRENEKERRLVAFHETGHALVGAFTPDYPPINKITVIPRSHGVGGFTQYREEEEKTLHTKGDLLREVDVLLGGRAAEQVVFNEISTGASNDISRATGILKDMITTYGMSDRFMNMTLGKSGRGYGAAEPELVREYSEETQKYIDDEIARIMAERYENAVRLLTEKRTLLDYIANRLLEEETMYAAEFNDIIKGQQHCEALTAASAGTASTDSAAAAAGDNA